MQSFRSKRSRYVSFRNWLQTNLGLHRSRAQVWHEYFLPSLIAGGVMAIIISFYDATIANVLFLASVGSSAVILSSAQSRHLLELRSALVAYGAVAVLTPLIQVLSRLLLLETAILVGLVVFAVSITMFWLRAFHPPAISAAIAFVFFDAGVTDVVSLFALVIVVFIGIRFLVYVSSQRNSPRKFWRKFRRILRNG